MLQIFHHFQNLKIYIYIILQNSEKNKTFEEINKIFCNYSDNAVNLAVKALQILIFKVDYSLKRKGNAKIFLKIRMQLKNI